MDSGLYITLLGIGLLILIILSGCFSSSETAFTSVTKFKFDTYYKKKNKGITYKVNNMLLNNYQMTLSTILVSNTLVNVAASTLSTLFFRAIFDRVGVPNPIDIAAAVATGVITFLLLFFGEFIPKSIARKHGIQIMKIFSFFIYFFYILFWPLNWILCRMVKDEKTVSATEQELDTLIDIASSEGVINAQEASLTSNSLKFDDTKIFSVMQKKKDISYIDYDADIKTISQAFVEHGYSRLPVKKDSQYVGSLHLKKFFIAMSKSHKKIDIESLLDPIIMVSQYDNLNTALNEMKLNQVHLALVTAKKDTKKLVGIVTLEDIIEELVGEIYDECDETTTITEINDFTWKVKEDVKAKKVFKLFKNNKIEVKDDLTIKQWVLKEFKTKKIVEGKTYENNFLKLELRRMGKRQLWFIIEEKLTAY